MQNLHSPKVIRSVRKTMSLHISHQGELIVKVPFFIPEAMINHFIKPMSIIVIRKQASQLLMINYCQTNRLANQSCITGQGRRFLGLRLLQYNKRRSAFGAGR